MSINIYYQILVIYKTIELLRFFGRQVLNFHEKPNEILCRIIMNHFIGIRLLESDAVLSDEVYKNYADLKWFVCCSPIISAY